MRTIIKFALLFIGLAIGRVVYSLLSGFILPDEAFYYWTIRGFQQTHIIPLYSRYIYQFYLLGILWFADIRTYLALLTFTSALYSIGIFWIAKKLTNSDSTIFLIVTAPIFLILSVFALTESISMFLIMVGIYLIKKNRTSFSSLAMSFGSAIREPLIIFWLGNLGYLLFKRKYKSSLLYALIGIPAFATILIEFSSIVQASAPALYPRQNPLGYALVGITWSNNLLRILATIKNFIFGAIAGLGLGFFLMFKNLKKNFLSLQAVLAIIAYGGTIWSISQFEYFGQFGLSVIARYAYSLIPVLLIIPVIAKKTKILLLLFLLFAGIVIFETRQPDLVSTGQYPWVKASTYVQNLDGKTLILGEPVVRLILFNNNPNVNISLPISQKEFESQFLKYDHIFVYGEIYVNHWTVLQVQFPYQYQLVNAQTQYKIHYVWNDSESYFYQVTA